MKNIILSLATLLSLSSFTNKIFLRTAAVLVPVICSAQYNNSSNADGSYTIYRLNSPTSDYGNRVDILKITTDSFQVRHGNLYFPVTTSVSAGAPTGKIAWFDAAGKLQATPIASVGFGFMPTTFTNTTRSISSATFQPSSSKASMVFYTIKINCVANIGSASSGTVTLQYSTNNGSSWIDCGQVENSNTVSLAIVLNSNTTQTGQLNSMIPAGAIVRMNQSSSGTTTITYIRGLEIY